MTDKQPTLVLRGVRYTAAPLINAQLCRNVNTHKHLRPQGHKKKYGPAQIQICLWLTKDTLSGRGQMQTRKKLMCEHPSGQLRDTHKQN